MHFVLLKDGYSKHQIEVKNSDEEEIVLTLLWK